jgi:hypothetical protein
MWPIYRRSWGILARQYAKFSCLAQGQGDRLIGNQLAWQRLYRRSCANLRHFERFQRCHTNDRFRYKERWVSPIIRVYQKLSSRACLVAPFEHLMASCSTSWIGLETGKYPPRCRAAGSNMWLAKGKSETSFNQA